VTEFDPGHDYEDCFPDQGINKPALWTMGVIEELQTLGMVDLAGDSPLANREQRKLYRQLKVNGYKPTFDEVRAVWRSCMVEELMPSLALLINTIIATDTGWDRVKALAREKKERDAFDAEWLSSEQRDQGWTLL
jgi:hypothetical protein